MSQERCPLGSGLYWDSELEIPDICKSHCEKLWQEAAMGPSQLDVFTPACMESCEIEYGDESLQRLGTGAKRGFSVLNLCVVHGDEMFAEEYTFECPNNQ